MKFFHSQTLLVFTTYCLVQRIHAECKTEKESQSSSLKLLDPLLGKTVTVSDERGEKSYDYNISFCTQLDDTNAGVVQKERDTGKLHVAGRINATSIQNGTNWMLLIYDDGDRYGTHCKDENTRRSHLMLLCNPDSLIGAARVLEENNDKDKACYYLFEIQTSAACFSHSSSPHVGWILITIFLVVAAVYLVVGFLYQRFVAQAKGVEQIPNLSFWQKLGGLSADGCDYVCRCNRREDVRSYKGLGDDQLGMDEEEDRDEHILPM